MEPMLYNVLCLDGAAEPLVTKAIRRALKSKPPRFFHDSVRHIVLQDASYWSPDEIDELFYRCTGLVGFSANSHCTPWLLAVFSKLYVRYLSLMLTDLFLGLPIDLVHPMFLSVTHLDLLAHHSEFDDTISRQLPLLPDLTHLNLRPLLPSALLQHILAECPKLRVLIIVHSGRYELTYHALLEELSVVAGALCLCLCPL
jgi:hypothetical protein